MSAGDIRSADTPPATREVEPSVLRQAIVGAAVGNTVEWYDFAIYGFLATYIAEKFFPSADDTAALLSTFAVFAAAFFMRPLGGSSSARSATGSAVSGCWPSWSS